VLFRSLDIIVADVKTELSKFAKAELMPGQAVTRGEEAIIMPSGPGRWLVDSEDAQLENYLVKMLPNKLAAVTGLTHSRVVVRVQGEKTTWLLASGVALDFHISAFPVGDVRMSHHHEIGLTLHRLGEDDFELYLFTSFARPFWEWICKTAEEVGFRVV